MISVPHYGRGKSRSFPRPLVVSILRPYNPLAYVAGRSLIARVLIFYLVADGTPLRAG